MAYTKYSLTPANNTATPPDGAPEGMLPSAVNDTMRDMMAQIRDCGDGIRDGTYTMTAPKITGGTITGAAFTGNTFTNPVITGGSINNTPIGASTASTGAFTTLSASGATTFSGATVVSGSLTANTFSSSGATITGGSINSTAIGGSTAAAGAFTTLSASGAFSANGGATLGDASGDALTINSSAVSIPNGLNFDSDTLVIDATNNRVGVGVASPTSILDVSAGANTDIRVNTSGSGYLQLGQFTNGGFIGTSSSDANAGALRFGTATAERMRITSTGNVGIGTSSPNERLMVAGAIRSTSNAFDWAASDGALFDYNAGDMRIVAARSGANSSNITFTTFNSGTAGERMRITSGGALLVGTTSSSIGVDGLVYEGSNGALLIIRSGSTPFAINRRTNDGNLLEFYQDTVQEGNISVSGTTVSYNGGHLSRWSQLPSNQKDDTLLKGTVMSNLDDMCVWTKDGEVLPNEQLNKMKVSDVEGDTNVAGVFVSWQYDEQCQSDDMNVAMTGDMIIRIAQGVVVQKGDLLMSAGDGTAKPQGDDIRRSKTVAKVTSNHVTCTYADGSYCVPCVLMAC